MCEHRGRVLAGTTWIKVLPGLVDRSLTHPITGSGRMRGLHRMIPRHPMN
jgi:hypothetical protein